MGHQERSECSHERLLVGFAGNDETRPNSCRALPPRRVAPVLIVHAAVRELISPPNLEIRSFRGNASRQSRADRRAGSAKRLRCSHPCLAQAMWGRAWESKHVPRHPCTSGLNTSRRRESKHVPRPVSAPPDSPPVLAAYAATRSRTVDARCLTPVLRSSRPGEDRRSFTPRKYSPVGRHRRRHRRSL